MTNEIASELGLLLARAHILMFEYDVDGFLVSAAGSCLGSADPQMEVHAGLVSPAVVRLAVAGERVVERTRICARSITVMHEPVRDELGRVERVVATAIWVTAAKADPSARWLELLPAAS